MNHITRIANFFQHALSHMSHPQNQLAFKENQIVMGHVIKHFPEQKALIQVGNSKLIAQIETSINVFENYWFRVKGSETNGLTLKMIKQVEGDNHFYLETSKDLINLFKLWPSKENIMLANELLKENIPITEDQLMAAIGILNKISKRDRMQAIQAIISAIKGNYPLTEVVIKTLTEYQSSVPLAKQIDQLLGKLQQEEKVTPTISHLINSLSELIQSPVEYNVGKVMKELLSLKMELIAASKELLSNGLREQMEQLIFRLNGQNLQNQDSGPTLQIISQIPLFLNNHRSDLTVQWNGRKQADGTIDPAYCRILFYLHLTNLKDTMIDVQIQNRVMNILIRNDSDLLSKKIALYSNGLKEILNNMNYYVSAIHVKPFREISYNLGTFNKQSNLPHPTPSYTGVDLKI